MRFPHLKHHQHYSSASHHRQSKMAPPSPRHLTKGEKSWGESTLETQRLVHKPKRGPEGEGANVRAKLPNPSGTAQKTSPLRPTKRIRYAGGGVRVGQDMLMSVLDPLPGVAEQRVVWKEWRRPTS